MAKQIDAPTEDHVDLFRERHLRNRLHRWSEGKSDAEIRNHRAERNGRTRDGAAICIDADLDP